MTGLSVVGLIDVKEHLEYNLILTLLAKVMRCVVCLFGELFFGVGRSARQSRVKHK